MMTQDEIDHRKASMALALAETQEDRDQIAARIVLQAAIIARRYSKRGASVAAASFLEAFGEGIPEVDYWFKDKPRENAMMWAASATQAELEAFLVAAIIELERSPTTKKATKRLAALAYNRMGADDRAKFVEWVTRGAEKETR